eukprot:TRINITY_DN489_c0_g1_i6.p2 TRINITY_DN489_c0_g1~~TRINITY_DN489_c0_g1_i6.p2  ORF type:complete len:167 (+),score=51.20 TRINITY_DN489_c0_g1_i6:94-594(+)
MAAAKSSLLRLAILLVAALASLRGMTFVGGRTGTSSASQVAMAAAKKAAAAKKTPAAKAADAGPKAMSKTARIEEVQAKLKAAGEEIEKRTIKTILDHYFESVVGEIKAKNVADLHGYISVKKVTKPATKAGQKIMVAGREIVTKDKPAETKVTANLRKALKDLGL